jgi:Mrp family chromosome partitioning ATPase
MLVSADTQLIKDIPSINARMGLIRHKYLVLSGKGGVGKSTVAAHLSYALASEAEAQVRG